MAGYNNRNMNLSERLLLFALGEARTSPRNKVNRSQVSAGVAARAFDMSLDTLRISKCTNDNKSSRLIKLEMHF